MRERMGQFISIEGGEGAGKSTMVAFIKDLIEAANISLVCTREPGGTAIAESLREVLLANHNELLTSEAELLLMYAGRVQNVQHVIQPALSRGDWVLSDRYLDASYAYQGGGRGLRKDFLDAMTEHTVGSLMPDMTLLLDVPVDIGLQRMLSRGQKDRIESEGVAFFERVRAAYLERAALFPDRIVVIDASQPEADVQAQLSSVLTPLLEKRG